jgi:hypothetical protein
MKLKQKKRLFLVFLLLLFGAFCLSPAYAAIVPCGNGSTSPCTLCHLITGFKNLVDWAKSIVLALAILGIVIGGILYIISSGSATMMSAAKSCITASAAGFAITMCAWLIVNAVMLAISAQTNLGVGATNWYTFSCSTASSALTGGSTATTSGTSAQTAAQIAQNQAACNTWCDQAGGDASYTSSCKQGCASDAATATQQASSASNSSSNSAQQQAACNTWCDQAGGDASYTSSCKQGCTQNTAVSGGTGTINDAANKLSANCYYCNTFSDPSNHTSSLTHGSDPNCQLNECSGNPGYTDCQDYVRASYQAAGCTSPTGNASAMNNAAQAIGDYTPQPGDVLTTSTHVVICEDVGCSKVKGASGTKDGIKESNGSYYINNGAKILKASDYCSGS